MIYACMCVLFIVSCLFWIPFLWFVSLTRYQWRVRDSYLARDVFSNPKSSGNLFTEPFQVMDLEVELGGTKGNERSSPMARN